MKELFNKQFWLDAKKTFDEAKGDPVGQPAIPPGTRLFTFTAGAAGYWTISSIKPVTGDSLPSAAKLAITPGSPSAPPPATQWTLHGVTSNLRYTTLAEKEALAPHQPDLGRSSATRGALIPIRKSAAWWGLSQDERRAIFEETSHHNARGMKYLPQIARRLHHCRDLAETQPFDFLTYFDFAPTHAQAFEDLLGELRATEEWKFVDREVDIRLVRA